MSDQFNRLNLEELVQWTFEEEKQGKIFGIYKDLFYRPGSSDAFQMHRFGQLLETPLGVAAGPHTQLAQNIVSAWLCGARFIELKTVQILDQLEVSKPCIDMADEGYNCEWSQELRLEESLDEYINAYLLIYLLRHQLGWPHQNQPGFIFNMSIGYDYEGILNEKMQHFLAKMRDCQAELKEKKAQLLPLYPWIKEIEIPAQLSNNVTLSTMHGCPPHEIEKIALYLIEEKKLHTTIKLNPTLLGADRLRSILNDELGFLTNVPDEAFAHDLKYADAVKIIKNLKEKARLNQVQFSLKLTNTLECMNHRDMLPQDEKMIYLSGRALHPISINLAQKLQSEFNGRLDISYCAGIDCFNASDVLACGLGPLTICSDLLKPGGYTRLCQYLEQIRQEMQQHEAANFKQFILAKNQSGSRVIDDEQKAAQLTLDHYADRVVKNHLYSKDPFAKKSIKTYRPLTLVDCIHAPCMHTCPGNQKIPDYMYFLSRGDMQAALQVILRDNPFPLTTGMVCDHLCMSKCTRQNYDNALLIRDVKRFIIEQEPDFMPFQETVNNQKKISIIGAGPSGLACAYFLTLAGFTVTVYEAREEAGGMAAQVIPGFRLSADAVQKDIQRIEKMGVKIVYQTKIDQPLFNQLQNESDFVYISVGAQQSKKLNIEGENLNGVYPALEFLSGVKKGQKIEPGKKIVVIGGGNSAIDTARTVKRIIGRDGEVRIVYRRSISQMPADHQEVELAISEGIKILKLANPLKIEQKDQQLKLTCCLMRLGEKDQSGREKPIAVEDSEFSLLVDSIFVAVGQAVDLGFSSISLEDCRNNTCQTQFENVLIGGDALHGARNIITAIADGKKSAALILKKTGRSLTPASDFIEKEMSQSDFQLKKAERIYGLPFSQLEKKSPDQFEVTRRLLTRAEAIEEAKRCLYCSDICNVCVSVCPNRANLSLKVSPVRHELHKINHFSYDRILIEKAPPFILSQPYQVINIADFCNECGNCHTFCPTSGSPYKDKLKISLSKNSFDREENSLYLEKNYRGTKIAFKEKEQIIELMLEKDKIYYSQHDMEIVLSQQDWSILEIDSYSRQNTLIEFYKTAAILSFLPSICEQYPMLIQSK